MFDTQANFIELRVADVEPVGLNLKRTLGTHADSGVVYEAHVDMTVGAGFDSVANRYGGPPTQYFGGSVLVHHLSASDQETDLSDNGIGSMRRERDERRNCDPHRPAPTALGQSVKRRA